MISKEAFHRWLSNRGPKDQVGRRTLSCDCPLATFLNETMCPIGYHWSVTHRDAAVVQFGVKIPFNDDLFWASQFVDQLDQSGPTGSPVTAGEALKVLNGIKS